MAKKYRYIIWAVCLVVLLLLSHFCFLVYQVNGESMQPTLEDGNLGVALRTTIKKPERFDIVVVSTSDKYLIKRVIGMPGEHIQYKDNTLYINGKLYKDDYMFGDTTDFEVQLDDEYFCLGDNRLHSTDSRWYGPFDKKDIIAVVVDGR